MGASVIQSELPPHSSDWSEDDWKNYHELLPKHPDLGWTTWTKEQVDVLSDTHDDHVFDCEVCRVGLDAEEVMNSHPIGECPHPTNECYLEGYCPDGQTTLRAWLDASLEFSWQADFCGKCVTEGCENYVTMCAPDDWCKECWQQWFDCEDCELVEDKVVGCARHAYLDDKQRAPKV